MAMTPGQRLGAYRVIRLLGKGGMGAVYEVEHVQLGVHYALKTFTLEEGHVETLKSKFLAEGKVLARLRNPNLVHVFDLNFDEKAGILYFVMDLLLSEEDTEIVDIMETNMVYAHTHTDKEEVSQMFSRYDLLALPVVDDEERLVGIVTVDDALDVMEEEATEDIEKMAAIVHVDKPYLQTSVWQTYKSRIPWLLLLMISATFTSMIITGF